MSIVVLLSLAPIVLIASAHSDPIAACREQHAKDSVAHIVCLENAVRQLSLPAEDAGNLGVEQVRAKQRRADNQPEAQSVKIIAATYAEGLGAFRMEDGQVWRETESTPERKRLKPNRQYSARIERGSLGGYRLYVDGVRRMFKVERIK